MRWDTPPGRVVRAYCGVVVERDETVATPTCWACRAAITAYDTLRIE